MQYAAVKALKVFLFFTGAVLWSPEASAANRSSKILQSIHPSQNEKLTDALLDTKEPRKKAISSPLHTNVFVEEPPQYDTSFLSFTGWIDVLFLDWMPFVDHIILKWKIPTLSSKTKSLRYLQQQEENDITANSTSSTEIHDNVESLATENTIPGEDLVVTVTFRDIYKTMLFIGIAWGLGSLSVAIGLPRLVGEIASGCLLGPPLADFVPYPGALVLTGHLGLIGLLLESGIGLDVAQLKQVGHRAFLLALVGSVFPLLAGYGLGGFLVPGRSAVAVGAAFAPSSLGVASTALSSGDAWNTPIAQMIVASSVFDDVFGLILLSVLEVIADQSSDPSPFDYVLPFLSSFGYVIILGWLGIAVLPRWMETYIFSRFASESLRDSVAMSLLMLLVIAYMLALNYSSASYLTGVFLAGLSFSQLHYVHAFFMEQGRNILKWLLRIFFAATIGFQVPITKFKDPYVLKWGSALVLVVLAKIPLSLFVPRFRKDIPDNFPYNPYYRDVIVTALSMTCRGEFNVIVASYALSEGLFPPKVYSAIIFAILLGSIVPPLLLTKVLVYYNNMSMDYMKAKHPIKRIGNTFDGERPLFLAIQARTPVHWNMQEAVKKTLEEMGLIIIDHRSWHTLGRHDTGQDALNITELFVQDTKTKVRMRGCFGKYSEQEATAWAQSRVGSTSATKAIEEDSAEEIENEESSAESTNVFEPLDAVSPSEKTHETRLENGYDDELEAESQRVSDRCEHVKQAIMKCVHSDQSDELAVRVQQWVAFVVDDEDSNRETQNQSNVPQRDRYYSLQSSLPDPEEDSTQSHSVEETKTKTQPEPFFSLTSLTSGGGNEIPYLDDLEQGSINGVVESWKIDSPLGRGTPDKKISQHGRPTTLDPLTKQQTMPTPEATRDNMAGGSNPAKHRRHHSGAGPRLVGIDLWETDDKSRNATRDGDYLSPDYDGYGERLLSKGLRGNVENSQHREVPTANASNVTHAAGRRQSATVSQDDDSPRHRRAHTFFMGMLSDPEFEASVIRNRLQGYVRNKDSSGPRHGN